MVGNGVTNWDYDGFPSYVEMAYWHGMYDNALYRKIHDNNCLEEYRAFDASAFTLPCVEALNRFEMMVAGTNVYDVYGICYTTNNAPNELKQYMESGKKQNWLTAQRYSPWLFNKLPNKGKLSEVPPCVYASPLLTYLNR